MEESGHPAAFVAGEQVRDDQMGKKGFYAYLSTFPRGEASGILQKNRTLTMNMTRELILLGVIKGGDCPWTCGYRTAFGFLLLCLLLQAARIKRRRKEPETTKPSREGLYLAQISRPHESAGPAFYLKVEFLVALAINSRREF
jgi:hypothetical protein